MSTQFEEDDIPVVIGEEIYEEVYWYPGHNIFEEPTIEMQIPQSLIDKSNPLLTREIDVEVDSMFDNMQETT